jgi:hypothetical protein
VAWLGKWRSRPMASGTTVQLQQPRYQEVAPRRQVHMVFEFIVIVSIYFRFALLAHVYISEKIVSQKKEKEKKTEKI